jgi:hypothetical protein
LHPGTYPEEIRGVGEVGEIISIIHVDFAVIVTAEEAAMIGGGIEVFVIAHWQCDE